jgi:hypothetical protein
LLLYLTSAEGDAELAKGGNSYLPISTDCSPEMQENQIIKAMCDKGLEWNDPATLDEYLKWGDTLDEILTATGVGGS